MSGNLNKITSFLFSGYRHSLFLAAILLSALACTHTAIATETTLPSSGATGGFDFGSDGARGFNYQQNALSLNKILFSGPTLAEIDPYITGCLADLLCLKGTDQVLGAQPIPTMGMAHNRTKNYAPVRLSEWTYASMQNPTSAESKNVTQTITDFRTKATSNMANLAYSTSPYIGPLYRGTQDEISYNKRLNQPTGQGWTTDDSEGTDETQSTGGNTGLGCKPMVKPNFNVSEPVYNAEWMRLEMDNCANQFILRQLARYTNMLREEKNHVVNGMDDSYCQPLVMKPIQASEEEYSADEYYGIAWKKLLGGGALARGGSAPTEPDYSSVSVTAPIAPPGNFGHTELPDLATQKMQYERIIDPSHPFSPRWDFDFNERDHYSPWTFAYFGNVKDAVRCAGTSGGGDEAIKVDVMNFRADRFTKYVLSRVIVNTIIYNDKRPFVGLYYLWWQPLGCTSDAPCCATRYDDHDKAPWLTPLCNAAALEPQNIMLPMEKVCEYLARPVVPVNALKMRSSTDTTYFADGADADKDIPEGYRFSEYFANHRPYMRCWDSGQECGIGTKTDYENEIAKSDAGSKYAIVGAAQGRGACHIGGGEGRAKQTSTDSNGNTQKVSPITSWAELKMYEMGAIRNGLFCLPKEEKLYKYKGSEDFVLYSTGAAPQMRYKYKDDDGNEHDDRYHTTPMPRHWRGYIGAPDGGVFPYLGGPVSAISDGLSNAKAGQIAMYAPDVVMTGGGREDGGSNSDDSWRLPFVAVIEGADNQASRSGALGAGANMTKPNDGPESIRMIAHNHGKFPDTCGNTTDLGMGEAFTAWKGNLPQNIDQLFAGVGKHTTSCADPALSDCVEPKWDQVHVWDVYNSQ